MHLLLKNRTIISQYVSERLLQRYSLYKSLLVTSVQKDMEKEHLHKITEGPIWIGNVFYFN